MTNLQILYCLPTGSGAVDLVRLGTVYTTGTEMDDGMMMFHVQVEKPGSVRSDSLSLTRLEWNSTPLTCGIITAYHTPVRTQWLS